jgi:transcriptional regulator with XRE-family HTH domain
MITNQRQHLITKATIRRFERAAEEAEADGPAEGLDPRVHQAMIDGLRSQLDDLRAEVRAYDALREGKVRRRVVSSLLDFPQALVEGRIVRGFTQKELGKKLGLVEQQIQRYEQTLYAGVGLDRLQEVADALGLRIRKTIDFDLRASVAPSSQRGSAGARRRGKGRKRGTVGSALDSSGTALGVARTSSGSSRASKRGEHMTSRKTGKAAASAAGKTLASKSSSKTAKRAAASDLAQVGNKKVTRKKAASAAGKTLASKSQSKAAKRAAASDLSQTPRNKKR